MTAVRTPLSPWALFDPEIVLARMRCLFPGVTVWAGEFTGSYWVLLGDGLREFKDPRDLVACLHANVPMPRPAQPRAVPPRPARTRAPRRRSWWRRVLAGNR